ncbi:transposase [Streptomyces sp. NPDC020792]|uniref:transposase n=1 Tax=Streptomyces sp. NPDC020792 TaxID=3365089 RepID=UPI0037AA546C
MAVEVTIAQAVWDRVFEAAMKAIADCFARPETRSTAAEMIMGLLAEVDTRNCWTLAQALGHPGPHRLQHLLSRARFDHDRAREEIARLVVRELAGQYVVLVADETGDANPRPAAWAPAASTPARSGASGSARSPCTWPR